MIDECRSDEMSFADVISKVRLLSKAMEKKHTKKIVGDKLI
jgi:hypothetical protein